MDFRERLFELRRQTGLSQEELASLLGVTRQAVQKWEAGTSRPDMDNLVSLAEYFKVSLDYLVKGTEPTPPPAPTIVNNYYDGHPEHFHYEYKSKRTLFGIPLVHINLGRNRWARGIIAIGGIYTGVVALGGVAFGLLTLGGASIGLLLTLGAVSLGTVSIGGLAVGLLAWGGVSLGVYAAGGVAVASKVAVGGAAAAQQLAIGVDAEGAQTILIPMEGLKDAALAEAHAAIDAACQGAPGFVTRLLKFFIWAEMH